MEPALWPVFHCHHFSKEVGSVQWLQSASCCATDPARSIGSMQSNDLSGTANCTERNAMAFPDFLR
jgi:hypothetical protein